LHPSLAGLGTIAADGIGGARIEIRRSIMQVKAALTWGAELVRSWLNGWRRRSSPGPANVAAQLQRRLWGKPYLALEDVCCSLGDGVLILRGCVGTTALRDIALVLVSRIEGVGRVVNEIEVVPAATGTPSCQRRPARTTQPGPTSATS
jgi:hypothetical protein